MTPTVVIPTAGDRPWLPAIIAAACCPVVVVLTADVKLDVEATIVRDFGPRNIQRWWNVGIDAAGTDHVGLFNDDITIPDGLPARMAAELERTGTSLCFVTPTGMSGWAMMIDRRRIRPDERFRWWWGDNDLMYQALRAGGICRVAGDVEHHSTGNPPDPSVTDADGAAFRAKWGE